MEYSNLQNLITDLLAPLKNNPDALMLKVMGPVTYYKLMGLINSPLAKAFIPAAFDPATLIRAAVDKLDALPPTFWTDLEAMLSGVIAGDPEQTAKAKALLGGSLV